MITIQLAKETKEAFQKALEKHKKEVTEACEYALQKFLVLLEKGIAEHIAKNSTNTGQLLQSLYQKQKGLEGEVGATAAHAPYVEFGTRPHRPPFAPIFEWAWLKRHDFGIPDEAVYPFAKAVCNAIARYGTKERRPFRDTIEANEKTLNDLILKAIEEVAR